MEKERSLSLALSRLAGAFWLLAVVGLVFSSPGLLIAGVACVLALIALAFMPRVGMFDIETAAMTTRPERQLVGSLSAYCFDFASVSIGPSGPPPRYLLAA